MSISTEVIEPEKAGSTPLGDPSAKVAGSGGKPPDAKGSESSKPPDVGEKPTGSSGEVSESGVKTQPLSQGASIGDVTHSNLKIQQIFKEEIVGDPLLRLSIFDWKDALRICQNDELINWETYVFNSEFVESSLAALNRSRMLVIRGKADCGKESMARFLASRLRQDGIQRDTLLYSSPRNDVKLSFLEGLKRHRDVHGRVLIFRDALDYGNPGLLDFFTRLKGEAITDIARELERLPCYVIFTVASGSLPRECADSLPQWLSRELPTLAPEQLLQGVKRGISEYLEKYPELAAASPPVPRELIRQVAQRAGNMALAKRFIESHLISVLQGKVTVEQAFDKLDSLSTWFRRCPATDLEAWIYCLALLLTHSLGRSDEISWIEFFSFYDSIRKHILRWRGLKEAERQLDETLLQECACIATTRDGSIARDLLAFRDPGDAARLWTVFLSRFPSLAISLAPRLLDLTRADSSAVRARAAQALGRIGVLDSPFMAGKWLNDFAGSKSWRERSLAGYLAQGVLSTGDVVYREYLLDLVDRYAGRDDRAWTAIAIYKHIGALDLALALDKLKGIAETRLAPAFAVNREIELKLQQLDRELAKIKTAEASVMRQVLPILGEFYSDLLSQEAEIAQTFKYTLVSLCLTAGFPSVINRLSLWALGSPGMEALVCIVFLQKDGIADELTHRKISLILNSSENQAKISCSVILASITGDSEAVQVFAQFLQAMFAGLLNFFPPDAAVPMTHLIFDYLKMWVRDSLAIPACRIAMVELVAWLLHSTLRDFYEYTYNWLSSDRDFQETEMAAFAREARRFSPKRV